MSSDIDLHVNVMLCGRKQQLMNPSSLVLTPLTFFHAPQRHPLHGRQLRWDSAGQLDWDTRFHRGTEVDAQGRSVPENQRTFPSTGDGC